MVKFLKVCGVVFLCVVGDLTAGGLLARSQSKAAVAFPALLPEIELLRLDKIAEKQKTNEAQAALLEELHRQNLEKAKALQDEYQATFAATCRAHDFDPTNCILTPDGLSITLKALPAAAK